MNTKVKQFKCFVWKSCLLIRNIRITITMVTNKTLVNLINCNLTKIRLDWPEPCPPPGPAPHTTRLVAVSHSRWWRQAPGQRQSSG